MSLRGCAFALLATYLSLAWLVSHVLPCGGGYRPIVKVYMCKVHVLPIQVVARLRLADQYETRETLARSDCLGLVLPAVSKLVQPVTSSTLIRFSASSQDHPAEHHPPHPSPTAASTAHPDPHAHHHQAPLTSSSSSPPPKASTYPLSS